MVGRVKNLWCCIRGEGGKETGAASVGRAVKKLWCYIGGGGGKETMVLHRWGKQTMVLHWWGEGLRNYDTALVVGRIKKL